MSCILPLQDAGLPHALSAYYDEFTTVRGISVSCELDKGVGEVSRGAALSIYRVAQEALGNVAKHANAKHVQVWQLNGTFELMACREWRRP